MTTTVSKEFKQQVTELLKPIKDKALRDHLKKRVIYNVKKGGAEEENLECLKIVVPTYKFKMSDYPHESVLFNKVCSEHFENDQPNRFDEFGWHISIVDRIQWQIFFRGVQMVQAGALSENHNQGA